MLSLTEAEGGTSNKRRKVNDEAEDEQSNEDQEDEQSDEDQEDEQSDDQELLSTQHDIKAISPSGKATLKDEIATGKATLHVQQANQ